MRTDAVVVANAHGRPVTEPRCGSPLADPADWFDTPEAAMTEWRKREHSLETFVG